ncbi:unnamed protein product [Lampetra fluviatilis]
MGLETGGLRDGVVEHARRNTESASLRRRSGGEDDDDVEEEEEASSERAMKEEIGAAVCLMSRLAGRSERLAYGDAERFGRALGARLAQRFHDHWYPERPSRGQAYRCIRVNATQRADPVLVAACRDSGLRLVDLCLPRELTLWVDPCEVCCRYGEKNHAFTVARFDTAADRDDAARAMASLGHGDKPEDEALCTDSAISSLWPPLSSSSSSSSTSSSSTPSSDEEEGGGVAVAGQSRRPWPMTAMTSGGAAARYAVPVTLAAAGPHGVATLAPTSVHFQHPAATMAHYQVRAQSRPTRYGARSFALVLALDHLLGKSLILARFPTSALHPLPSPPSPRVASSRWVSPSTHTADGSLCVGAQVAELVYHPLYMWPAHPASYPARRRRAPPVMRAGARVAGAGGAAAATAGALPTTLSPHSGHFVGPSFIANATSPSDGKMRRGPNRAAITAATTTPPPGFGLHRSAAIGGRQQQQQQQRVVSVAM